MKYNVITEKLVANPQIWLVTGVAGFIGSNLLETLLELNQKVVGLDNLSTGKKQNLVDVQNKVSESQWDNFNFIQGDILNINDCRRSMRWERGKKSDGTSKTAHTHNVEFVLHQAALGSVSRSIEDPIATHNSNVNGFLNILSTARDFKIKRFIYAASSSTYGDHPDLPKVENRIGRPLSPYAVSKWINEVYAEVYATSYQFKSIGLRYFNVFGKRQDPNGAYAAVIPKWTVSMIQNKPIYINGDGENTRDFCPVENAVQANIIAAKADEGDALNQVYNIAVGNQTSLNELFDILKSILSAKGIFYKQKPNYCDPRTGDVLHSFADISKAAQLLGYRPTADINRGMELTVEWYLNSLNI